MQLKPPFKSLREVFAHLPQFGEARNILRRFNSSFHQNGQASSVKDLALELGFNVSQVDGLGSMTGRLVQDPFSDNRYCIEVNKHHSLLARRWAVLHEIGHYFLHVDLTDPLMDDMAFDASGQNFYVDTEHEVEANAFASVLLFGDGSLEAACSFYGKNKRALAQFFGVSERVIEIAMRQYL